MTKKLLLLIISFLCLSGFLFSQDKNIEPLKLKKIKKETRKKKSTFYYPVLFERYVKLDTSLTTEEFRYLYYGYTFQQTYLPYGTPELQDSLLGYLSRPDLMRAEYEVAARIGGELLKDSPFRLRETFITAVSFEMAGNLRMSNAYFNFYEKQVDAIMSTGDGLSTKTAFVVIYVQDEYEIIEVLGFKFGGNQYLLTGNFDMLELQENPYGIDALYFDVGRLLEVGFK
jgi:hypothetical protein